MIGKFDKERKSIQYWCFDFRFIWWADLVS